MSKKLFNHQLKTKNLTKGELFKMVKMSKSKKLNIKTSHTNGSF